jgi:guanylate kinase
LRQGIPFVVAAPSGTGKTTVCRRVVAEDGGIEFSISHTTRPQREGEREGVDYHFVDLERFEQMIREGAFLEWAVYNDRHYGTSWAAIEGPLAAGRDVLLEIEVQGARQVRERRRDARLVFLLPPSFEVLRKRLESRATDAAEEIQRRLAVARREIGAVGDFDYAVVNDDLDACVATLLEIIRAEREGRAEPLRRRHDPARARERLGQTGAGV